VAPSLGRDFLFRSLAGLQAGLLGGMVMFVWTSLGSWVQGQSLWTVTNLWAYTFHGSRVLRPDLGWRSGSGIALMLVAAGLAGALFALLRPANWERFSSGFLGVLFALAVYLIGRLWIWNVFNPVLGIYSTQAFVVVGHLLFGMVLALVPGFQRSLERHFLVH
jgi:hypothetical protein